MVLFLFYAKFNVVFPAISNFAINFANNNVPLQ